MNDAELRFLAQNLYEEYAHQQPERAMPSWYDAPSNLQIVWMLVAETAKDHLYDSLKNKLYNEGEL